MRKLSWNPALHKAAHQAVRSGGLMGVGRGTKPVWCRPHLSFNIFCKCAKGSQVIWNMWLELCATVSDEKDSGTLPVLQNSSLLWCRQSSVASQSDDPISAIPTDAYHSHTVLTSNHQGEENPFYLTVYHTLWLWSWKHGGIESLGNFWEAADVAWERNTLIYRDFFLHYLGSVDVLFYTREHQIEEIESRWVDFIVRFKSLAIPGRIFFFSLLRSRQKRKGIRWRELAC